MSELLSCPMCGGNNIVIDRDSTQYFVVCDYNNKGCGAASGYKNSANDAIKAWNTRHVTPLQQARLNFIESYRSGNVYSIHVAWNNLGKLEGESNG